MGQIRRRLSMAAVQAQVDCLLSKLHQLGPGNVQLAKRRTWAIKEDQRMNLPEMLRKGFIKTALINTSTLKQICQIIL